MLAMRDGIQSSRKKQTEDKLKEKKRAQPTKVSIGKVTTTYSKIS